MRHHPENIGVAVLAEDFSGALAGLSGIAIVDTGHQAFSGLMIAGCTIGQVRSQELCMAMEPDQ
jgi:hypothetical protein